MAQLIFKCPYLKGGGKNISHLTNMTKYISTRKGVEKIDLKYRNIPATKKQKNLIKDILKDFPNSKYLFEYNEYKDMPTIETASDFISTAINLNIDVASKKENYVNYIANRPQVERISSHGLFTAGDKKIILSQVAKEVSEHKGNVWLPIIALKREDAERTGYDNAESWKLLLEQFAIDLAKNLKISDTNFRWYAAYHNHENHPHVHMICYSTNPKEGFLSKTGIKNIKSELMKSIYGHELELIYAEKTQQRDRLKEESKKSIREIFARLEKNETNQNNNLEKMFLELSEKLKTVKGKKVYGYLPQCVKKIVDNIADELCSEPSIQKAYELWWQIQNDISNNYSDRDIPKLPLSKQKEFKSIKNHIIKSAVDFSLKNNLEGEKIHFPKNTFQNNLNFDTEHMFKNHTSKNGVETEMSVSILNLMRKLANLFETNQQPYQQNTTIKIDSKRLRKLREKKMTAGQKTNDISITMK